MEKKSLYTIVAIAAIAAGSAFIAHSWDENRGFFSNIFRGAGETVEGAGNVAAAAVDLPQDLVTGERPSLDPEDRGALGTVVGGTTDFAGKVVAAPGNIGYHSEVDADDAEIIDEAIFPVPGGEEEDVEIEEED